MAYLLVALVSVAVAIFAMQNTDHVTVGFIVWKITAVPLAGVVLVSLAAGMVIVGVPLWFRLWRARSRLQAAEARLAAAAPPPAPPASWPPGPPSGPTPPGPPDRPR